MERDVLNVHDIYKSYGTVQAVRGISFSILRGEIFGLLGPNGAGKSTTISMLAGLTNPNSGQIRLNGMDLQSHRNQLKSRIGFVPQELALYPTLSGRDNLRFFGRIYGLHGRELNRRVDELLTMIGLADRANDPIETYSGGMKRRINLAAGLLHKPDILFLDEPTVGVDPQSRNAIFENIEALNRSGMTILYTTHYMEEAERLCHRVAIVDHGTVIALNSPANLIHDLGRGMIRLEIADGLVDAVRDQTAALLSVREVTRRGQQLDIQSTDTQQTLIDVLAITNRLDARVVSLQIMETNLETVFLSLTGKNLRD
jgi:ABC-2 type transport system ATP-binding protein